MGACASKNDEDGEMKKRSQMIDKKLEEDSRRLKRECKILLLGSGESGKSTIVKQMKIIHQNGYTVDELAMYRLTVYKNVVDCAKALIAAMRQFDILPEAPGTQEYCDYLMEYSVDPDPHSALDVRVGQAVTALWKDPSIPKILDHSSDFFDEVNRIASPDYIPIESDVLRARTKTTEESSQNRMMESLVLFDSVVNSRWFMRTSIILFLNKVDLFKAKLGKSPLGNYFPDYSGGNDVNRAAKYLLWRFNQVNRAHLNLYPQ
ncbi:MAG: hypothetical protein Q9157_003128 [Trypethelium eluteriae]